MIIAQFIAEIHKLPVDHGHARVVRAFAPDQPGVVYPDEGENEFRGSEFFGGNPGGQDFEGVIGHQFLFRRLRRQLGIPIRCQLRRLRRGGGRIGQGRHKPEGQPGVGLAVVLVDHDRRHIIQHL